MRRSARGEQSAFSLFPFLAVLLCTMGSLVVLLVAISQISREKAEVEAEVARLAAEAANLQADSPERRQLESQIVEAAAAVSRLRLAKGEGERRLQQEQQRLSDIEDHISRLSDEAEALIAETKELIAVEDQHYDDAKIAEQELERLNKLAGEIEDELEQLKHAAAGRERKFAVVPLREGRSGTLRPPVYYECTKSGVVLQPEGVQLTWQDLVAIDFSSPVNAAARAVSRYYEEHPEARAANESGRPYPLLIVRPDGVFSYYQARAALESADVDYGYQPVAADWQLEYGERNPVLATQVEDAVRTARAEREGLAKVIPQVGAAIASAESDARMAIALSHGRASGVANQAGGVAGGQLATGQPGILVRPANPRSNNPFDGMQIEGYLPGEVGGSGYNGLASGSSAPLDDTSPGPKPSPLVGGMMTPPAGLSDSQAATGFGSQGMGIASSGPAGIASDPNNQPADQTNASGDVAQGQRYGAATTSASSDGKPSAPTQQQNLLATTGNEADASGPAGSQASVTVNPKSKGQAQTGAPGAGSASNSSGRDGLPMIRPIRMYVSNDRVVVLPDSAQTAEDMAKAATSTQAVVFDGGATTGRINDVIGMLKKHADTWGIAGDGMYWDPRLVLNVAGDGADRANDVHRLLEAAGVKVQAYPVTTAVNPAGGSDASRR